MEFCGDVWLARTEKKIATSRMADRVDRPLTPAGGGGSPPLPCAARPKTSVLVLVFSERGEIEDE